jgi:UTP-glucose-1-phosphate uridylyltransferase
MTRPTTQETILAGIESNILIAERQISQLKKEFAASALLEQSQERRLIRQQLRVLQENLELLRQRRMYALELMH